MMSVSGDNGDESVIGIAVGVTLALVIIIAIVIIILIFLYKKRFVEYHFLIQFIKIYKLLCIINRLSIESSYCRSVF